MFKFLNLTRHTNGRLLLKIVHYLHVVSFLMLFFLQIYESNLMYKIYLNSKKSEDFIQFVVFISVGTLTVFTVVVCIVILQIARRSKDNLRQYLKYYCIWNSTVIPWSIPLIIYTKYQLRKNDYFGIFLFVVFILFKVFIIAQVFFIYFKLKSSLINMWKDFEVRRNSVTNQHEDVVQVNDQNTSNPLSKSQKELDFQNVESFQNVEATDAENFSHETVVITNEHFKEKMISPLNITIDKSKMLGEGQFGTVYKAYIRERRQSKIEVAAKIVKEDKDGDSFQMLLQEIKISIIVGKHPNIVQFIGVTSDASINAQFAIITEYCSGGSLETFLTENRHTFVDMLQERGSIIYKDQQLYINLDLHGTHSSLDLVRFSHQLAQGMEHLASKKIIHGDLAARNVLLTKDLNVKLTDFGMSRRLYTYKLYVSGDMDKEVCLPWRWMAFETLTDLKFSEKSDVWAFGVTLWEIFSLGKFPYGDINWSDDLLNKIKDGLRPERPAFATKDAFNLMQSCWNLNPNKRHNFSTIVHLLNDPKIFSGELTVLK